MTAERMYSQHEIGAGAEQHYAATSAPTSSPFTHQAQYPSPVYGIDPHASAQQHLRPGPRLPGSAVKTHSRQLSADAAGSMPPPSATSPRPRSVTPSATSGYRPLDRSLPPRDVDEKSLVDAFVQFILYCNPSFPLSVDTTDLKAAFTSPPKSEGNAFDVFLLFDLVRKKNLDEIKTWNQLALELGVKAPDSSKGQSNQKVQQYSVRLKRWMRSLHVNAFFEYLTGKLNPYFTHIPPLDDPAPVDGRDGTPPADDLVLRALDPAFRPKRGRRRNSETDQDDCISPGPRPGRHPDVLHSAVPMTAIPSSAHPDHYHDPWAMASALTPQSLGPWSARPSAPPSAVPSSTTSNLRWQHGAQSQTPSTPHPLSAAVEDFDGWPKSANTPSSRKRRRHGPAVSSAWSSGNAPGAKPRGRPPSNRNVQDGPFGTFPADPTIDRSSSQPASAVERTVPSIEQGGSQISGPILTPLSAQSEGSGRPHRLSLQVPPHTGGPVRLASPPALFVNGERKESETKSDSDDPSRVMLAHAHTPQMPTPQSGQSIGGRMVGKMTPTLPVRETPGFAFEALKRVLASDLLRANLSGRKNRLTGEEARRLADAVLDRMGIPKDDTDSTQDDLARLTAASWLGIGYQLNVPLGPATGHNKRIAVTRFRTDAHGYEEITYDDDLQDVREVFDLSWDANLGGCMGKFEMKSLSIDGRTASPATPTLHDAILQRGLDTSRNMGRPGWLEQSMQQVAHTTRLAAGDDQIDWKQKYEAMEFAARVARGALEREKDRMLQQVLDALL